MIIEDIELAKTLEKRRLWNRAARQWLVVLDQMQTVSAREKIIRRRAFCLQHSVVNRSSGYGGIRVMNVSGGVLHG
ncbi:MULTISPECIES: PerC family transcriptional regulator [Lonsdalea]|uniref:Uncharacterized protein n=2 Tax=Lonsdalea TaxID=1082702 RepID=A0ACD1JHH8_9GAMM|nr:MULTISPECIES: PerC family transcriptional regulator [Lonsdalea]RAT16203.1 hypothetical protein AU485_01960 [Lonsdalea quercina]RAT23879.1 hypothetical protein AU487_00595 [Lonsdalea populi]RAT25452.1 hypothetical protein AU489_07060 [Lonsdalea populi]RAT28492.1 hypothetical protein AU488_00500 [Lonsdalea populi]RAT38298.1 hypothetical protein AU492_00540 [Lonsdalea populi]